MSTLVSRAAMRFQILARFGLLGCAMATGFAAPAVAVEIPVLEFIQPANGAVFSLGEEVPVVVRAFAPDDVFAGAEVFANDGYVASVTYCCALCPCAAPFPGMNMILQIPVPWHGGIPPLRVWQGWAAERAGVYRLTAQGGGLGGTSVTSAPVTITVLDRTLHIAVRSDGAVSLRIAEGSMVPGGYEVEASEDLQAWTRLGSFQPGNVAAFYYDVPPDSARKMKFYRSVYVPPPER